MSKDFVSDLHFENMEYAHIIRSFDADSKLLNIEKPELPAGVSFFSAADIKGKKNIIFFKVFPFIMSISLLLTIISSVKISKIILKS